MSVVIEEPTELSNDSKVKVYVPDNIPFVLIKTSAEDAPFEMVTNEIALLCLRLIFEPHKLLISDFTCSTDNIV